MAKIPTQIGSPQTLLFDTMFTSTAVISDCEKYRYALTRAWDDSKPMVMFLMLNPSTADAAQDDPTIRRCIAFAKSWGYGSLCVGNLFAYRSTTPKELLSCENPVGDKNKFWIDMMAAKSKMIVCAWGNANIVDKLAKRFTNESFQPLLGLNNLYYIDLAKDGTPKHPLYLKGDLIPINFEL